MRRILIIMLSLCVYTFASAQTDGPMSLTLDQAIELGNKYNASIKNSAIDVKLAEQKVREIMSSGFPQLNGAGSLNDYIKSPISLIPAEIFGGPKGTYAEVSFVPKYNVTGSVSASQLLFNGSYFLGVKASKEYAEFIKVQQEKTKFDVERDITKAYLTVLSTQATLAILEEAKNRIDTSLYNINEVYKQGFAEKLDVDRLRFAQSQLAQQLDQLKSTIGVLKALLNLQMGYDVTKPIILTSTLQDMNQRFSVELYSKTTFDPNAKLEIQVLNKGLELQKLTVKANKMGYYPTLAAFGTYQLNGQNKTFEFPKYYKTALVGLQLSVPIFDGFAKDAKIKQAKLTLEQVENTKANVQNALTLAYINANNNVNTAKNQLELNKQSLALAESIYNTTKTKFDLGVGNSFELTTADGDFKNAKIQYTIAQYNLVNAIYDLKVALGK